MRKSYALLVALAFAVSACGGGTLTPTSPTSPTNPTPGQVQWSTVQGLNFDPSVVTIGKYVQIDIMMVHSQAGVSYQTTFVITKPDGSAMTKVSNGTSVMPGLAGSGFGYYPESVGTYSVKATVTQSVAGETKGPEERSGSFQATK